MDESTKVRQPSPRHYIQPKTVWNDKKGRTLICIDIWEKGSGYEIELLVLYGKDKPVEFVTQPWMDVFKAIEKGHMQQAFVK